MANYWKHLSSEEPLFISKQSLASSAATDRSNDSITELLSIPDDNWKRPFTKLTTSNRSYSLTDLGRYERYFEHLKKQFGKRGHSFTWDDFIVCFDLFEYGDKQINDAKGLKGKQFFDVPGTIEGDCKWTSGSDFTEVTSLEDCAKVEDLEPKCTASPKFKELVKFWSDVEDRSPERSVNSRIEKSLTPKISSHHHLRKPSYAV